MYPKEVRKIYFRILYRARLQYNSFHCSSNLEGLVHGFLADESIHVIHVITQGIIPQSKFKISKVEIGLHAVLIAALLE